MFRNTPLAAAVLVAFATPLYAQTTTTPATGAQPASSSSTSTSTPTQTADSATLPAVKVTGQSGPSAEFAADVSSVGAKVPTALRDIPQAAVVVPKSVLQSQAASSFYATRCAMCRASPSAPRKADRSATTSTCAASTARTDIYLDGFRDRGQYYRDTFNLESIDVLYGPSSLVLRTRLDGRRHQSGQQAAHTEDRAPTCPCMAGTHDRYRTTVDLDHADPVDVRVPHQRVRPGPRFVARRDEEQGLRRRARKSSSASARRPQITLSALIQHNRDQPDYGIPPLQRATQRPSTSQHVLRLHRRPHDAGRPDAVNARIEHRFNDNLKVRNQTQFSHYSTEARATNAASPC